MREFEKWSFEFRKVCSFLRQTRALTKTLCMPGGEARDPSLSIICFLWFGNLIGTKSTPLPHKKQITDHVVLLSSLVGSTTQQGFGQIKPTDLTLEGISFIRPCQVLVVATQASRQGYAPFAELSLQADQRRQLLDDPGRSLADHSARAARYL